jgi:hypothetical protein
MPDHAPESMSFVVGTDLRIPTPADQVTHWGFSAEPRRVAQADRTVHSLYLGLEHLDFAASGPAPRRGNRIELYDNGRDAFASLAADLYDVTSTLQRIGAAIRSAPGAMGLRRLGCGSGPGDGLWL